MFKMKKVLFVLLACVVAFASCSKDDDEHGNDELVGTNWIYEENLGSYIWSEDITFNSVDKFTYHYMEKTGDHVTDEGKATGSYKYNPPIVTGSITMDGVKVSLKGEVNGSRMTVYIDGEEYGIYHKEELSDF